MHTKEEVEVGYKGGSRGCIQRNETWKGDGTRRNSSGGLEELARRRGRYVVGSAPEEFLAGENGRGMEGQCDCTNLQTEGGHTGLWELQRHQHDISYNEDLGKNNRQTTKGGDKHMRIAVPFHAGQRDK